MKPKLTIKEWLMIIWYAIKSFFTKIRQKLFPRIYYMTEKGECLLNYCNKLIDSNFQLDEYERIQSYDDILVGFQNSLSKVFGGMEIDFEDAVKLMQSHLNEYQNGVLIK